MTADIIFEIFMTKIRTFLDDYSDWIRLLIRASAGQKIQKEVTHHSSNSMFPEAKRWSSMSFENDHERVVNES